MRDTIERKLIETTIKGFSIEMQNGTPTVKELAPVIVYGKVSREKAVKELQRVYGKENSVTVAEIKSIEKRYVISVDDFVKLAKPIEETKN